MHIQDGARVQVYNFNIDIERIYLKFIGDKFSDIEYGSTNQSKDNGPKMMTFCEIFAVPEKSENCRREALHSLCKNVGKSQLN